MSILTLEALAEMSGGEKIESKREGSADPFKPGIAYAIEITEAASTQSKNGFEQVELKVSIVEGDGTLRNAGRLWETLPLVDHLSDKFDETKLKQYRNIFGRNLLGLLRAAEPSLFQVYARKEGRGKATVYFDADGNQLTAVERRQKTEAVENAIVGAAKAIKADKLNLAGKRLYLVKVAAANGKVYTNWFSEAPEKFPAHGSDSETPF